MNFWGHLKTITRHRHYVIKHCAKCGILMQGLKHDLSKYSPTEFCQGIKYYIGTKSPNEGERADRGYSIAWIHHQGRNKHHFEYWKDYNIETKMLSPVKMPYRYVAEMFCDRVAASKIYQGNAYTDRHPLNYFSAAKKTRQIHEKTSEELELLLTMLAEKGEKITFAFIKDRIKNKYTY